MVSGGCWPTSISGTQELKEALNASTLICLSAPACSQVLLCQVWNLGTPVTLVSVERSKGEGRGHTSFTAGTKKSLPTGAMAGTVHNPSCGAPCQLHSRGVKPLQRCSTQALPKKQELREDNTWMELTQSPCALLICGVGRAEVTGVAHPCSHPNPEHPSLQGMSPFLKWLSSSYLKVCFAYNSLLFPCPPPSKQFLSLHLVSPASKTKPLKEHLDLHICAGFFKSI